MSTHTTQCRKFGVQVLPPTLALLMLLGAGQTTEPKAPQAAADKPADSQAATVDGQKIYQASCQACHATGVANAPKLGDKAAWAPRIAKGNDALFSSVKNGLNAMPPKGTCMSCSDDDLRAAVEYLVAQGS